jgi:hypothetical protein
MTTVIIKPRMTEVFFSVDLLMVITLVNSTLCLTIANRQANAFDLGTFITYAEDLFAVERKGDERRRCIGEIG